MAENGAFSTAKSAIFPCLEPALLNTSHWFGGFYVHRLFWRPGARKMSGAIFGREARRRDVQRPSSIYRMNAGAVRFPGVATRGS